MHAIVVTYPSSIVCIFVDMQSKAYAKAQRVPTTWSQEDQGYIARWYSYYCAEAYYEDESVYGHTIRKVLPINFTLLNLAVLYTIMTRGISWYHSTYEVLNKKHKQASKTYLAVGVTTATLNFLYFTAVMYIRLIWLNVLPFQIQIAAPLTLQASTKMNLHPLLSRCWFSSLQSAQNY